MKKTLSVVLSVLLVVSFAFFAIASSSSDGETSTQAAGEAEKGTAENNVGNYSIEIKSARLTKNWEGKPSVVVTYGFTNNDDDPASFMVAFQENAYQNGVGLEKAYTLDDTDPYDEANQSKEIKKGASLDVEVAYILNDTETDVEVEVEEWLGLSDDKVSRTFSIK